MHHEFCVTFVKADTSGEPIEVHHRHVEAENDESAAIAAAMEAARDGTDVSECDVLIRVIKVVPPELKKAIKLVMKMYAIFRPESGLPPMAQDEMELRFVQAGRKGGNTIDSPHRKEWEDLRDLLAKHYPQSSYVVAQDTGKPKTNLH